MKCKLIILFLFSFIKSSSFSSSAEIWNKVQESIKNRTMLLQNKGYFIFDESNYTKLNINDTKMQILYKMQERLYKDYGIANYIFVVDSLSESYDTIKEAANKLYYYISYDFKINITNSVISLLSINSRRIRIKLGSLTQQKISDSNAQSIINDLKPYLRSKDYYHALMTIIEDINFYYNYQIYYIIVIVSLCISSGGGICYFCYLCDACESNGSGGRYSYSGGYDGGYDSGGGDYGGGGCDGGATGDW